MRDFRHASPPGAARAAPEGRAGFAGGRAGSGEGGAGLGGGRAGLAGGRAGSGEGGAGVEQGSTTSTFFGGIAGSTGTSAF